MLPSPHLRGQGEIFVLWPGAGGAVSEARAAPHSAPPAGILQESEALCSTMHYFLQGGTPAIQENISSFLQSSLGCWLAPSRPASPVAACPQPTVRAGTPGTAPHRRHWGRKEGCSKFFTIAVTVHIATILFFFSNYSARLDFFFA